jgi:putative lipoic acid-binding regulatory protein
MAEQQGAPSRQTLIEYPCDFPIKVMGARVDGFAQAVIEVVLHHAPDFDPAGAEMRPSSKGNYLAVTCTFRALSQAQVDAMYRELTAHPMVKVVL